MISPSGGTGSASRCRSPASRCLTLRAIRRRPAIIRTSSTWSGKKTFASSQLFDVATEFAVRQLAQHDLGVIGISEGLQNRIDFFAHRGGGFQRLK